MNECAGCGRYTMNPEGPAEASILIVGDAPSQYDIKDGKLWTGDFGDLLRAELRRQGIIYKNCRVTNMWLHPKSKECEFETYHVDGVLYEMADRPVMLLLGADTVKYLTGYGVSEVSGLRADTLPHREGRLIPKTTGEVYALFSPAIVLHEKLGEVRWGLQSIARQINGN